MTRTIRFRTTAVATVLAGVLLAVMGLAVVALLRAQLNENLDDALQHRADGVVGILASDATTFPIEEDTVMRLTFPGSAPTIIGDIGALPDWASAPPAGAPTGPLRTVAAVAKPGVRLRMLTRTVERRGGSGTLQLAIRLDDVTGPTRIVGRALVVAIPAALALIAALVWWLVGVTLRPVEAMRAQLAHITASDLTRRVTEPGTGDEIDRLARTTNATLARLDTAVERQRRLVADVSHELRSPLARMRAALEVAMTTPATDPAADPAAVQRSVLDDTVGLQHLVDDLLHLAQSDADRGTARGALDLVDLDDVVLAEVAAHGWHGRVRVDVAGVAAVQVRGNRSQLARAVRNLLDNAGRHASTLVTVTLAEDAPGATLTVTDDGPGIAPADRERVFERFARLDTARSTADGGTGLGLAITSDVVTRHGGTISIEGDRETVFVVHLPRPA